MAAMASGMSRRGSEDVYYDAEDGLDSDDEDTVIVGAVGRNAVVEEAGKEASQAGLEGRNAVVEEAGKEAGQAGLEGRSAVVEEAGQAGLEGRRTVVEEAGQAGVGRTTAMEGSDQAGVGRTTAVEEADQAGLEGRNTAVEEADQAGLEGRNTTVAEEERNEDGHVRAVDDERRSATEPERITGHEAGALGLNAVVEEERKVASGSARSRDAATRSGAGLAEDPPRARSGPGPVAETAGAGPAAETDDVHGGRGDRTEESRPTLATEIGRARQVVAGKDEVEVAAPTTGAADADPTPPASEEKGGAGAGTDPEFVILDAASGLPSIGMGSISTTVKYLKTNVHNKRQRDLNHLVRVQNLVGHTQAVRVLRASVRGELLASAGDDNSVRVWQVVGGPSLSPSATTGSLAESLSSAWAEDSFVLPVYSPLPRHIFLGHTKPVTDLAWSEPRCGACSLHARRQHNFLLSSSEDGTVKLWFEEAEALQTFEDGPAVPVTCVCFDPSRSDLYFVSGSLDGSVRLWDVRDPKPRSVFKIPDANVQVTALTFSALGTQVVVGTNVGILFFLYCKGESLTYATQSTVRSTRGPNAHGHRITGLAVTPRTGTHSVSERVLVTTNDSRVRVYFTVTHTLDCKYRGHTNAAATIRASYSDDGRYIVSGSEDGRLYLWATEQPSGDGTHLTTQRRDRSDAYETLADAHGGAVLAAVFAPRTIYGLVRRRTTGGIADVPGDVIITGDELGAIRWVVLSELQRL